jgi:hypothetical protein
MRSASCGFENPDGMEFLQPSSPVTTTSPLPARAPTPIGYLPWSLAVKLRARPTALEGQRNQVVADRGVMEERG